MKDLTTVNQETPYTVQDCSGNCLTEGREILNRWTEYRSELYNHKVSGDPLILNCPQTDTEDDRPILRKEVETAVQSLKKGKSAGVDNIPAELVHAGGEDEDNKHRNKPFFNVQPSLGGSTPMRRYTVIYSDTCCYAEFGNRDFTCACITK